jgi:hypothetical protein
MRKAGLLESARKMFTPQVGHQPYFVSSKHNGHVTPITGRLPGVNESARACGIVQPRIECLVSSPAHFTRVNHDWLLKSGVTRAGRGARGATVTVTAWQ